MSRSDPRHRAKPIDVETPHRRGGKRAPAVPAWLEQCTRRLDSRDLAQLFGYANVQCVHKAILARAFPKPDIGGGKGQRSFWEPATIIAEIHRRRGSPHRAEAIRRVLDEHESIASVCDAYGLAWSTLKAWVVLEKCERRRALATNPNGAISPRSG